MPYRPFLSASSADTIWRLSSPELRRPWAIWGEVRSIRPLSACRWAGGLPWAFLSASPKPEGQQTVRGGTLVSRPDFSSSSFRHAACWWLTYSFSRYSREGSTEFL